MTASHDFLISFTDGTSKYFKNSFLYAFDTPEQMISIASPDGSEQFPFSKVRDIRIVKEGVDI